MRPTISIVIPCYNEEENLAPCLESILNQTELPEEVVFVNNNSTDNSRAVAESFVPKFQQKGINFKIFDVAEQGIISARTVGFAEVKNDLIGSIDVDTVIDKNWVRISKECFNKQENLIAIGGQYYYKNIDFLTKIILFFIFLFYKLINWTIVLWGCSFVFRKSAYDKIGGFGAYKKFINSYKFNYVYDDNFLTENFRRVGKIKFVYSLKARGTARGEKKRMFQEFLDFWRIKAYFKK